MVDAEVLRDLPRVSAEEIAWGWPYGNKSRAAASHDPVLGSARQGAEHLLRDVLERGPVVVSFSGGRDSSAVLALAAHVARRDGLPLPAALTVRYPGVPEADESSWQEVVIRHLGIEDWQVVDGTEAHGALGTAAQQVLRRAGAPLFPATSAALGARASWARGGTLVTGEHGDWVLGYKRMTVARSLWRRRGRGGRALWREAAVSLAPAPVRARVAAQRLVPLPWLRSASARRRSAASAREQVQVPLRWDREVVSLLDRRFLQIGSQTQHVVAQAYGARLLDLFSQPALVEAYAREGGAWGFASRTAGMRHLVGDLLPAAVVERTTKAYFTRAHATAALDDIVRHWDGTGVDADLVDPERLRREWSSDAPHPLSLGLLQQVWLHRAGAAQ
jgi:asparagine synthase (glutamine-hydrolysing)